MTWRLSRRTAIMATLAVPVAGRWRSTLAQVAAIDWANAPIGWPGRVPGDGFRIGHGFACENTWFAAGWWHTGEDWYATDRDTAGAMVYAIAAGEVVYADFNYPGRVVIVRHEQDLYSMYGHLDPALGVRVGDMVAAGAPLGTVLAQPNVRAAGQAPSHLHFEVRTFLTVDDVNGTTPQHGVNCGFQCPPGPGYWPAGAAEHPAALGWRNPTHLRFSRLSRALSALEAVPNSTPGAAELPVYATPDVDASPFATMIVSSGVTVPVGQLQAGDPAGTGTSAETYDCWLRLDTGSGEVEWVRAMMPSATETGSDGRPSSLDVPWLLRELS